MRPNRTTLLVCGAMLLFPFAAAQAAARDAQPSSMSDTSFGGEVVVAALRPSEWHQEGSMRSALLTVMVAWLADSFGLPAIDEHPRLAFIPPTQMAESRYRALIRGHKLRGRALNQLNFVSEEAGEIAAFYDDGTKMIYLPQNWRGESPAELSILIHELVHHLQNLGGMEYRCQEAREELAFAAQQRWLSLFGGSLESDFGMDRMTVFLRTRCLF